MVKEMRFDSYPYALQKHNHVLVKISVSILLIGLAFRLYFSQSSGFPPVPDLEVSEAGFSPQSDVPVSQNVGFSAASIGEEAGKGTAVSSEPPNDQEPLEGRCDLFIGDWVPDKSGPMYTNESCHVVEEHQNCMKNGRPDSGYLYWRWKPRGCELPHFDGKRFLEIMRNKRWAFVGDSISRNHVQSLLCLLSTVEAATAIYHDEEYKSKTWHFPYYNFTLAVIWSPFLVDAAIFEDINGVSTSEIQLHLDIIDKKWSDHFLNFDYMIISGGKWFLKTSIYYENNTVTGCHYCPGKNFTDLGFEYSYRKALQFVLNFIVKSNHKGMILFRTSTPDHFENGEWHNGGTCKRKVPFKEGEASMNPVDVILRNIELEEFKIAEAQAARMGVNLKLLDTTQISLLRPDGHPGPYRQFYPFANNKNAKVQNDCLHWCLPGPIDSWSDIIMEMVLN